MHYTKLKSISTYCCNFHIDPIRGKLVESSVFENV